MVDFAETQSGSIKFLDLDLIFMKENHINCIKYFLSKNFGRILVINDEIQHVEAWTPFYHEIVVHLPCSFIPEINYALILGGGSLFAAEELLKYETIRQIDLVDYDLDVIEATKSVYPERRHVFDDPRLNIVNENCENYVSYCIKKYDIIINDAIDLFLYDSRIDIDIYDSIHNVMTKDGICSDLIYRNIYQDDTTRRSLNKIASFPNKAASLLAVPEYPGIFHILTMWGKNTRLSQNRRHAINKSQAAAHSNKLFKIFSPEHLSFYLYLPPYLSNYIK